VAKLLAQHGQRGNMSKWMTGGRLPVETIPDVC
jgi:hypothetical protein